MLEAQETMALQVPATCAKDGTLYRVYLLLPETALQRGAPPSVATQSSVVRSTVSRLAIVDALYYWRSVLYKFETLECPHIRCA